MKVINKGEFLQNKDFFLEEMKKGKIFVYPTDTIYGIGCNALNNESVRKIGEMKKREKKAFSIISPGKEWIEDNCFVSEKAKKWLEKLPGAYTLILELKNRRAVAKEVNLGFDTLGIRIPEHWFSEVVIEAKVPFVTTSVNLSGEEAMKSVDDINEEIKNDVDYIIDEGFKDGKASTIINLVRNKEVIKER